MANKGGGGLSRKKDYGSKKKPYPKVKSKDFAGKGRSYPIPTKKDAVDALRLAGLHGRSDIKSKVYKRYPSLKKELGGLIDSLIPDLPDLKHGGEIYSEKVPVGEFKNPAEILRDMINSGKLSEFTVKENVPKQNFGGVLKTVAPLADLAVPGVGTGIAGLISLFEKREVSDPFPRNQMEQGGEVAGMKQYNAPTHQDGGMLVNKDGIPGGVPAAEIEGTENSIKYSALPEKTGSTYVFSDANGTSEIVKSIMNKYKNKNTHSDLPTRASMEMEVNRVEKLNEAVNNIRNAVQGTIEKTYGGKMEPGGVLPPANPLPAFDISSTQLYPISGERPWLNPYSNEKAPFPYNTSMITENKNSNDFYTVEGTPDGQNNSVLDNTPGPQNVEGKGTGIDFGSILRTAGLAASGLDAFQKPSVEQEIYPDYRKADERMNAMRADLTQARQDVTGASNRASELARNAASSYSQYRARELGNIGNLQDQLGRIGMQEQQMRNQILGQQGQYEAAKATTIASIKDDVQQRNLANTARAQDLRRQFFSDIVAEGDRLSTIKNLGEVTDAKIQEGMKILNMLAPDLDINKQVVLDLIGVSKGQKRVEDLSDDELILYTRLNG